LGSWKTKAVEAGVLERWPEVRGWRPAMARRRVDLPQPEGPRREVNWPWGMVRETLLTAVKEGEKAMEALERVTSGGVSVGVRMGGRSSEGCGVGGVKVITQGGW
jgi:hypothetical protein